MTREIFTRARRTNRAKSALSMLELVFNLTAKSIRGSHDNAVIGIFLEVFRTIMMVAMFYFMMTMFGMRRAPIRGDFILFIMSGVFTFKAYNSSMSSVMNASNAVSGLMQHSVMSTAVAIGSTALGTLYRQVMASLLTLTFYHCAISPITIDQPAQWVGTFVLAWFCGSCFGLVFYAAKPWSPWLVGVVQNFYLRANFITSGKMFVANALPQFLLVSFDWNPLFHIIDQGRGFIFLNYFPRNSNIAYPLAVTLAVLVAAMMLEFLTRRSVSLSWFARGDG